MDNGHSISWSVNRISDLKSNYIDFTYSKTTEGGIEHLPHEIKYTGNITATQEPFAIVRLNYEDKNQPRTSFFDGTKLISSKQLLNIEVQLKKQTTNDLVRKYKLNYVEITATDLLQQERLESIQECVSETTCLPKTYFVWDGGHASNIDFTGAGSINVAHKGGDLSSNPDGAIALPVDFYSPDATFFAAEDAGSPSFKTSPLVSKFGWEAEGGGRSKWDFDHSDKLVGDVNGDGLSDIVAVTWESVPSGKRRYDI